MKKNCVKKALAWLLTVLQLLACTALADTVTEVRTSVFSAMTYAGGYTVRFLDMNGDEIYQVTDVDYATPMDGLFSKLLEEHPEYTTVVWSVTGDYRVLNNAEVFMQPENAIARVGGKVYPTLQAAIDADETAEGSTVLLMADTNENIDTKGKSFTLDMGGHTLTAGQVGARAYTQMGGTVTVLQGMITGANIEGVDSQPGFGAGMYVRNGALTARYVTIQGNKANYDGGGLYGNAATIVLENCTVSNNTTTCNGGAGISVENESTLTAADTTVSGNAMSSGCGTGIYIDGSATLTNCTVSDNYASDGALAAIYVNRNATLSASGLTVCNNTCDDMESSGGAGGIVIEGGAEVQLNESCRVENNTGYTGGIDVNYDGLLTAEEGLVVSGNTGYMCGGIYVGGGVLKLKGAQILNNTATDTDYGVGGVQFSGSGSDVGDYVLQDCVFRGNKGATGAFEYSYQDMEVGISGCLFEGNVGTKYAGAIYENAYDFDWLHLRDIVVTGNTGYKAGGIYVANVTCYDGDKLNKVYGNISTDGNRGNDITIAKGAYAYNIHEAKFMGYDASGKYDDAFEDFTWIGGVGTATLAVGEAIDAYPAPSELHYTAGVLRVVAQDLTKADQPTYYSLQEAIDDANPGDTIVLTAEDKEGAALPVSESIVVDKPLTLKLNNHQLIGTAGAAVRIGKNGKLTLTGKGQVSGIGDSYAIVNEGELILNTDKDTEIVGIDHQGSLLQADGPINAVRIALGDGKVMTGGSNLTFDKKLEFVLPDATIQKLNEGWKSTGEVSHTLIVPMQNAKLKVELTGATAIRGTNGYVTVEMDAGGNLIARSLKLNGVYVDGQAGNDGNSGLKPDEPVKTFKKAREVLEGLLGEGSSLTAEAKAAVAGVYVMGQLAVDDAQPWSLSQGKRLIRYPDYKGYLVQVAGGETLTLQNIVVDGSGQEKMEADYALVKVLGAGILNINGGAVLQNNQHTRIAGSYHESGGAVYCDGGTVNLNGGSVTGNTSWYGGGICMWNGTLTMNDNSSISNNSAVSCNSNYSATGGGVALLKDAKMTMDGGTVSGNTSTNVGGGVTVGSLTSDLMGAATLTMNDGTVSGNIAGNEGGGIYIQADATGYIYGGSITNNESHGGYFGGGGIYVNGARTVNNATFGTGKLYLENVIITNNSAGEDGGGLAGCGTSKTMIYVTNGGAIYGNTIENGDGSQLYIDATNLGGFGRSPFASVSAYMLGDVPYEWIYSTWNKAAPPDALSSINSTTILDNQHTDATAKAARDKGKVWITGNTAVTRGGGIGSNGSVQIGTAPTEGEWTPEGSKTLTGRDMKAGEFTFTVRENGTPVSYGKSTAPKAGETEAKIEFAPSISYNGQKIGTRHTYVITEDTANLPAAVTGDTTEFTVTVTVIAGPKGKLTGYVSSIESSATSDEVGEVAFKNEYKAAKAKLKVKKTVTGQKPGKNGNFTFELALKAGQANAQYVVMAQPATVTVTGNGTGTFDSIAFEKAGDYVFTIKEVAGKAAGYTYDGSECQATVKVTDTNGELKVASVSYSKNGKELKGGAAEFENTYTASPTSLSIPVSKTVQGDTPDNKTFTFELKAATEKAPMPKTSTVTITGTGTTEFGAIEYTEPGVWKYTVRELTGSEQYYTYDKQIYTVTVTVTDEGGSLKAAWTTNKGAVKRLAFVNSYATPTPTPAPTPTPGPELTSIRVTKQWQDMDDYDEIRPESVTIHLERRTADGEYETIDTVELTGDGNTWRYTFQSLPARDDDGLRYQYRVREEEVEGYSVQYDGYNITNVHVVATPTPEMSPIPTPTNVGPKPEHAVGMKYVDGEWVWIDDMGVPLGVVAITGDNDNLTAVLIGMALFLVGACGLAVALVRRRKKKE